MAILKDKHTREVRKLQSKKLMSNIRTNESIINERAIRNKKQEECLIFAQLNQKMNQL